MTKMFAVIGLDKPDHFARRQEVRPAHLAYWEDNTDVMVLAGPFLDENGNAVGSMMVIRAVDHDAATALVAADPYATEGVFGSVEVKPWNWVIKRPEHI